MSLQHICDMALYMMSLVDLSGLEMTVATGRVNTELLDPIFCHGSEGQAGCLNYFSMY